MKSLTARWLHVRRIKGFEGRRRIRVDRNLPELLFPYTAGSACLLGSALSAVGAYTDFSCLVGSIGGCG